jgi:hypothetical protein
LTSVIARNDFALPRKSGSSERNRLARDCNNAH